MRRSRENKLNDKFFEIFYNNLNKDLSAENKNEKAKVITARLERILKINPIYGSTCTGIGPGYLVRKWLTGYETTISVLGEDDTTKEYLFKGIILPDSIGNRVEIWEKEPLKAEKIHDVDLDRWYK